MKAVNSNMHEDSGSPADLDEKGKAILDRIEIEERVREKRKTPNLMVTLAPLWVWVLGIIYLPEGFPSFAKALFHASCLAGFAWFAYQTWVGVQNDKEIRKHRRAESKREQFKKSIQQRKGPPTS